MGYISAHDFMSIKISDLRSLRNGLLHCENARRYLQCYVIAEVQERGARLLVSHARVHKQWRIFKWRPKLGYDSHNHTSCSASKGSVAIFAGIKHLHEITSVAEHLGNYAA